MSNMDPPVADGNASNNIFADNCDRYWAAGLPVIPLKQYSANGGRDGKPTGKEPVNDGWEQFQSRMPTEDEKQSWKLFDGHGNIGLPLGPQSGLVAIDIDTDDPELIEKILSVLPPSPWKRIGQKGMVLVYKYDGQPIIRIKYRDDEGKLQSLVEMLGAGSQIVLPPSIHPKTVEPYRANADLVDVLDRVQSLPANIEQRLREAVGASAVGPSAARDGVTTKGVGKVGGASAMLNDQAKQVAIAKAKPDNLASVLAGCAWMEHCETDAASLSEAEWYAMLSISSRCENGRVLSHKLSEPYTGYTEKETDDKLHHALNDAGPVKCDRVAGEFGFEGCARCPFRASINSPMNLAGQPRAVVKVQREVVYVEKGRTYFDLPSGEKLDPQEFGDGVRAKIGPNPHDKLMGSPTMPKVKRRDYRPGNPDLIIQEEDGTKAVNLWHQGGITPVKGDPKPILAYFDRLIPIEDERRFLLQFLAHLYRHPEVKIEFGAIIVGGFGSGKSTFHTRIVSRLFGEGNARKLEGAELASPYNARWVDCQVLMIEEAHHGERLEVFKSTLELLVADRITVHDKYIRSFQGRTPRGITMVSNDDAPMVLPLGDRRWFLTATLPTPETADEKREHRAFFERLYEVLDQDDTALAAFAYHLQHEVSLEGFKPKGEPPMTAAKETATKASRTPVAQVLGELITAGAAPFHKDIVEAKEVVHALKMSDYAHTLERISPQKIANVIRAVSGKPVNVEDGKHLELVIGPGKKPRPWAIRNTARWTTATREDLKEEFLRLPGDAGDNVADMRDAAIKRMMEAAAARRTGG